MPSSEESRPKHKSLADLAETIEASANPELSLLKLTIERYQEKDAELAEAIRYCAIPRSFDEEIIGVLRGEPQGHATNSRLLDQLRSLSFVLPKGDHYAYHDNVRDILLEEWSTEKNQRADFDRYTRRLAAFYEAQHETAQEVERDFERVAHVLEKANTARYLQIASIVETGLVSPLVEALYHHTVRSAQDGYEFFEDKYLTYENTGQFSICQALLNSSRDYLLRLPPGSGQDRLLQWMWHWQARSLNRMYHHSEAEAILSDLLPDIEDDDKLKGWVLSELGRALQNQFKLRPALEVFERELELTVDSQVDPYNIPSSYLRLTLLYSSLGEWGQATRAGQAAIQHASREGNLTAEATAHLYLSDVYDMRGDWQQAFDSALEALRFVRTNLTFDRSRHRSVLGVFMSLLARRDPRVLDTLYAESKSLLGSTGHPLERFELEEAYAVQVQGSFRLAEVGELLANLRKDFLPYISGSIGATLNLREALLLEDQGKWEEATVLYDRIIEDAQAGLADHWDGAAALYNRALCNAKGARWARIDADIRAGRQRWEAMGHETLVAYSMVIRAHVLRLQGQFVSAQQLLEDAQLILGANVSTYLAQCYKVEGDCYRYQGLWTKARERYRQAVDIARSYYDHLTVARLLGDMAAVAGEHGRWKEAKEYTNEASQHWQQLHNFATYEPAEADKLANEKNGYGAQLISTADGDRFKNAGQARDALISATELVPDNFWYRLNLAYSHAERQDWNLAAREVEVILNDCHEWLRTPGMEDLIATYEANSHN